MSKLQNAAMSKCSTMKCSNDKEETPGKVSHCKTGSLQQNISTSLWEQDHDMESPPIWQHKCSIGLMFCPQYNMEWPPIWQTKCSNVQGVEPMLYVILPAWSLATCLHCLSIKCKSVQMFVWMFKKKSVARQSLYNMSHQCLLELWLMVAKQLSIINSLQNSFPSLRTSLSPEHSHILTNSHLILSIFFKNIQMFRCSDV